jgi:hypothetical protein
MKSDVPDYLLSAVSVCCKGGGGNTTTFKISVNFEFSFAAKITCLFPVSEVQK